MTSIPKWKRLGYADQAAYSRACKANRKTKKSALIASGCKNKARDILRVIWDIADFDKPISTFTKEQIMSEAQCSYQTVQLALNELRAEGSIIPIYSKGGRGIPSKYRLGIAGKASTPSDDHLSKIKAEQDRDATWRFLKGKYGPLKALEILGDPEDD